MEFPFIHFIYDTRHIMSDDVIICRILSDDVILTISEDDVIFKDPLINP